MASSGLPDWWFMALFGVGALVMRGAGCTVNDLVDRDFDRMVTRTVGRPIANGDLSVLQAFALLAFLLGIGLAILLQFNGVTVGLGLASLILVIVYPFMKRFTYWPQAFLGLTFNWGALMGWAAVTGALEAPALWMYIAGLFWTLGYDTIYAHQDKADDLLIGVKSTALKFGTATTKWLVGFYAITIVLLGLAGSAVAMAWPYYAGLMAGAAHLTWQVLTVNFDTPKSCLRLFKSNRDFGLIILVGIVIARAAGAA